jgi:hypothetical protein
MAPLQPTPQRLFADDAYVSLRRLVRLTSTDKPVQDLVSNSVSFNIFRDQWIRKITSQTTEQHDVVILLFTCAPEVQ